MQQREDEQALQLNHNNVLQQENANILQRNIYDVPRSDLDSYYEQLANYNFNTNPLGLNIGELIGRADDHRDHLKIMLNNPHFRDALAKDISTSAKDGSTEFITSVISNKSISGTESEAVRHINNNIVLEDQLKDQSAVYAQYWYRKRVSAEGRALSARIETCKKGIAGNKTLISNFKKELSEWRKKFEKYDVIDPNKWISLIDVLEALKVNEETKRGVRDFIESLTNENHEQYIQNRFFRYYVVSQLFKQIEDFNKLYYDEETQGNGQVEIAPIYRLIFYAYDDQYNNAQVNNDLQLVKNLFDQDAPMTHVTNARQFFKQIASKLLEYTSIAEFRAAPSCIGSGDDISLSLSHPVGLFPKTLHGKLINNNDIATKVRDSNNNIIRLQIRFPLTDVHHNIARYSYMVYTQSLRCLELIDQAEESIKDAEKIAAEAEEVRKQQPQLANNEVPMRSINDGGDEHRPRQATVHPQPQANNVGNPTIRGQAQEQRRSICTII